MKAQGRLWSPAFSSSLRTCGISLLRISGLSLPSSDRLYSFATECYCAVCWMAPQSQADCAKQEAGVPLKTETNMLLRVWYAPLGFKGCYIPYWARTKSLRKNVEIHCWSDESETVGGEKQISVSKLTFTDLQPAWTLLGLLLASALNKKILLLNLMHSFLISTWAFKSFSKQALFVPVPWHRRHLG